MSVYGPYIVYLILPERVDVGEEFRDVLRDPWNEDQSAVLTLMVLGPCHEVVQKYSDFLGRHSRVDKDAEILVGEIHSQIRVRIGSVCGSVESSRRGPCRGDPRIALYQGIPAIRINTDQYGSIRINTDQYESIRINTDPYGSIRINRD